MKESEGNNKQAEEGTGERARKRKKLGKWLLFIVVLIVLIMLIFGGLDFLGVMDLGIFKKKGGSNSDTNQKQNIQTEETDNQEKEDDDQTPKANENTITIEDMIKDYSIINLTVDVDKITVNDTEIEKDKLIKIINENKQKINKIIVDVDDTTTAEYLENEILPIFKDLGFEPEIRYYKIQDGKREFY